MSALKLVIDVGLSIFGGRALTAGVDMALTAAELTNYVYSKGEDPVGAFSWWLSPCGGTDLVPDEIKQVFDILSNAPTGKSSYKQPKKIKKHSGKKGDEGNPRSQPGTGTGTTPKPNKPKPNPKPPKKKCNVPPKQQTKVLGHKNILQLQSCDSNDDRVTEQYFFTTMTYHPNAAIHEVKPTCSSKWGQACYHYSSAIRENSQWSTLTCPQAAATKARPHPNAEATGAWKSEHH
ncbi:hypothetical protein BHE90_017083, partial [Fusarium euwallaceae]